MTLAFSISLKTNLVLPEPVGPATSDVNGWQRDSVMSTKQTSSLTPKSQERADDRTQRGEQQGGNHVNQVVHLFSIAVLYTARMRTVARRIHRATAVSSLPTALFIANSLPSPPSPLPGGTGGLGGKGVCKFSYCARCAHALSRCECSKTQEIASFICFIRLSKRALSRAIISQGPRRAALESLSSGNRMTVAISLNFTLLSAMVSERLMCWVLYVSFIKQDVPTLLTIFTVYTTPYKCSTT